MARDTPLRGRACPTKVFSLRAYRGSSVNSSRRLQGNLAGDLLGIFAGLSVVGGIVGVWNGWGYGLHFFGL